MSECSYDIMVPTGVGLLGVDYLTVPDGSDCVASEGVVRTGPVWQGYVDRSFLYEGVELVADEVS